MNLRTSDVDAVNSAVQTACRPVLTTSESYIQERRISSSKDRSSDIFDRLCRILLIKPVACAAETRVSQMCTQVSPKQNGLKAPSSMTRSHKYSRREHASIVTEITETRRQRQRPPPRLLNQRTFSLRQINCLLAEVAETRNEKPACLHPRHLAELT